jgi:hypothetical protein
LEKAQTTVRDGVFFWSDGGVCIEVPEVREKSLA